MSAVAEAQPVDLALVQWKPWIAPEDVSSDCRTWDSWRPTAMTVISLAALDRPRMVKFCRDTIEGEDGPMAVAEVVENVAEFMAEFAKMASAVHARLVIALTEAAGLDFDRTFPKD